MIRRTLVVLVLCAAAAASAEEEQFVVVPNPALPGEVPAGSREDQILWREARDAMVEGNQTLRNANQGLYELHYARLNLDHLEKGASPADAERLRAIRARLEGPGRAVDAAMPRGPLGRCRYEILYFQQSMSGEPGTDLAKRLPEKRAEARKCKEEHQQVIATLGPATAELRAVIRDVGPELQKRMAAAGMDPSKATGTPTPPAGAADAAGEKTPASAPVKL